MKENNKYFYTLYDNDDGLFLYAEDVKELSSKLNNKSLSKIYMAIKNGTKLNYKGKRYKLYRWVKEEYENN